ncbi:MAG: hypothetical protein AAFV33_08875, partial [Chloroflexota bacterium]
MFVVFIVLAVVGLLLTVGSEVVVRSERGAGVRKALGDRAQLILGIVGSIGTLLLIVGVVGALLNRYVPGFDVSQGIAFDSRESVTIGGTLQIRYYGIIIVLAMLVAAN